MTHAFSIHESTGRRAYEIVGAEGRRGAVRRGGCWWGGVDGGGGGGGQEMSVYDLGGRGA